jgi:hypothetical protein
MLAGGTAIEMPVAQSVTTKIIAANDPVLGEHPKTAQCRSEILSGLNTLMPADINALGINVSPACFDGASQTFIRIEALITNSSNADFASSLAARAAQLAPAANLTPVQVAARMQFAGTCAGCHFTADTTAARDLGQGSNLAYPDRSARRSFG